jgi:tetratricopeptide (TPR) repeat protein
MLKIMGTLERRDRRSSEAARAHFRKALATLEQAAAPDELAIASACVALGMEEQAAQHPAAARRLFERALEIRRRFFGEEHTYVAYCMHYLASLRLPGDLDGARELAESALAMLERCAGPDFPAAATDLVTLGAIEVMAGNTEKGFLYFDRAVEIDTKFFGPAHAQLATTLSLIATVHAGLGDMARAEPLWRRAIELVIPAHATRLDTLISCVNHLMVTLRAGGRHQDILAFAEPLIARWELDPSVAPELLTALWNGASEAYFRLNKSAKAEKLLKRALSAAEKRFGKDARELDPLLHNLVQLLVSMGRKSEAAQYEQRRAGLRVQPS